MRKINYVTFIEWEHDGKTHKRTQEQYDLDSVLIYVRNLNLKKIKAITHIYSNGELVDIVNWNNHKSS